ncbi:hypothetical protein MBM_07231 [Drepanopeziza brunnea f. sp. 'multigermtubi' MB_m1]|uniref:Uncharacterized protein n=1 Tax=Marssonina brunnea f. sp. multigermtubi (strain MB_m1) TaxID=1072389 RepID=K1WB30_MARBU|nr:uncharacterized protein MBM_07231 [Drepanopeziza brunnea f. sp. 'multigermtubi' MB_m1]EKD14510.1 hypothetical protein MBM_07231 [Drepanopeziza brunnea f. sp. 'multigermtubi' MB_m1]
MSREKIMSRFNAKNREERRHFNNTSTQHFLSNIDLPKQARLKERKALQVRRLMVLLAAQHKAVLIYAADQATKGGKGATKQLYAIRTKPIASHRVDMHTEKSLSNWFYTELVLAIQFCGIGLKDKHRIANINEKSARICMPAGEEVIVPIGIKEMYTRICENRLFVTVIEAILADRKAIPLMIIVPGKQIIASWFSEKMTGHKVVTVFESGYTNDKITIDRQRFDIAKQALEKVKAIKIKKQEASLKIANAKLKLATIKIRNDRYNQGVLDRKAEKERKKWLNEAYKQQGRRILIHILPERKVLIRDREKQLIAKELEADNIDLISFRDAIANEKAALKEVQERDLATFADLSYSIDLQILTKEKRFRIRQNLLSCIQISDDDEDERLNTLLSSPLAKMMLTK